MAEFKFKNLNQIDTVENPAEGTTIMGFENGNPIQMPMSAVRGSGGVFVINPQDDEFSTTDTSYGDKVLAALQSGKTVYYYFDEYSGVYSQIRGFWLQNNSGDWSVGVIPEFQQYQSSGVDEVRYNGVGNTWIANGDYTSFAITPLVT